MVREERMVVVWVVRCARSALAMQRQNSQGSVEDRNIPRALKVSISRSSSNPTGSSWVPSFGGAAIILIPR